MHGALGGRASPPSRGRDEERLLVGVVGEIYCRLNTFSNDELIRTLERHGGEAWLSDIGEWVFYTNLEQRRKWIPYAGERFSLRMATAWIKDAVQRRDEHALLAPFHDLLRDREEPKQISIVDRPGRAVSARPRGSTARW